MKTNLEMLISGMEKVKNEKMTIVENAGAEQKGYIVINEGKGYIVPTNESGEIVSCSCPHHFHRKAICKHMIKVSLEKNLNINQLGIKEENA